jgi:hypothetical protein
MDINSLKRLITEEKIIWRNHILVRMRQRGVRISDVINCVITGEIIETYEDDQPFPSTLILGKTLDESDLHVVCAEGQNRIWMITVYYPDQEEWLEDFKTRRR